MSTLHDFDAPGRVIIDVVLVLDKSVSMAPSWPQTISGLNEYIGSLRAAEQNDSNLEYRVSLTAFGVTSEVLYDRVTLDTIPTFTEQTIRPDGPGTALYEAVGTTLEKLKMENAVLVVIVTDGAENSSRLYREPGAITKLTDEKKALGNFTFVYLGAEPAAWSGASTFSSTGNTWAGTAATRSADFGMLKGMTVNYSSNVSAVMMARSRPGAEHTGRLSTETFYSSGSGDMLDGVDNPTLTTTTDPNDNPGT